MAVITYEDMSTLIPNTTMRKMYIDGTHRTYHITPIDGYVLHDNALDEREIDEETGEYGDLIGFGYYPTTCTCGFNYDFSTVQVTDENGVTHTAYGSREFFARPSSEVPDNQIYTVGNNHEIA